MKLGVDTRALIVVCILASCTRRTTEERAEHVHSPAPPSPIPSVSESPAATPAAPECPKPVAVPPRVLASGWPGLVGTRVRLRVAPMRAIDFATWLVVAGGQRFVVVAPPDTAWGVDHVFVVAGSTIVLARGPTSLPELIVVDKDCNT